MKKVRFADEEMSEEKVEEKSFFTWLQSIFFCEPSKIYKEEEEEDEEAVEDITVEANFVPDNMEPVSVALPTVQPLFLVGDAVDVYSRSAGAWCSGYVTDASKEKVRVVFQIRGKQWYRKELSLEGNGACAIGALLRRAKQQQLAGIELAKSEELFYTEQYNRLRLSGKLGSVVDTGPFEKYFKYSGLPKMVLKQICIESGILPDRRIDFNRFAQCCRMVAHCQNSVVRRDLAVIRTMENGSDGLKRMLRESLVKAPFMLPNCVIAFGRHVSQSYLSCKAIVEGDWHFA